VKIPRILASSWNALRREFRRNRPMPGRGIRLYRGAGGCVVTLSPSQLFHHPWEISTAWRPDSTIQPLGGQWTATLRPGFVDGKDVTIDIPIGGQVTGGPVTTVASNLTDETAPALVLSSWRDPIASAGFSDDGRGNLVTLPAAGYPAYFSTIGVQSPDAGSAALAAGVGAPSANQPTRYLLGTDIFLTMPRLASTAQQVTVLDPETDSQSIQIQTVFQPAFVGPLTASGTGSRAWLSATSQWTSPQNPTPEEALLGTAVQPNTDQILIATLWMVSPPNPSQTAAPDASWMAVPQYETWWNLNHAALNIAPAAPPDPITFPYAETLADGVGQNVINSLLSPINDQSQEISAYLNQANFQGLFFSI